MRNIINKGLVDKIRKFIGEESLLPAKERGMSVITIRSGDVHKNFGLKNRYPAVCLAMDRKIEEMFDVKIIKSEGSQGANHYVTYGLTM
jgi:hypothetical protein